MDAFPQPSEEVCRLDFRIRPCRCVRHVVGVPTRHGIEVEDAFADKESGRESTSPFRPKSVAAHERLASMSPTPASVKRR